MGKLRDLVVKMDFEGTPKHVIVFDPNAETRVEKGRDGDYDVIPVLENGITMLLPLSNQSLVRQLKTIKVTSKLELTRSGTAYQTAYSVKDLGAV
jgi:hypothetical protein